MARVARRLIACHHRGLQILQDGEEVARRVEGGCEAIEDGVAAAGAGVAGVAGKARHVVDGCWVFWLGLWVCGLWFGLRAS